MANVFIAGMATALPGLATATYVAWQLQLHPSAKRAVRHLSALVVSPIAVLVAASVSGAQGAMACLVLASLVTPMLVAAVNRQLLVGGPSLRAVCGWVLLAWSITAITFLVVASTSSFWAFNDWGNA